MKILVLLESPGKIKKITQILRDIKDGNVYTVKASKGHISRIQDSGVYKMGLDTDTYEETLELMSDKVKLVAELKKDVKAADMVYLASDGDREGDLIAYSWVKFLNITKSKYKRVIFNEITTNGVLAGIKSASDTLNVNSVNAARTRTVLDKIVGYRLSPVIRSKLGGTSAGRVQSAVLKILSERERLIQRFKPKKYFILELAFSKNKTEYKAQYKGTSSSKKVEFDNKKDADKIISECKDDYLVNSIVSKTRIVSTKPAFTTSTLQQDASSKLGYSPSKTMKAAQKLYEAGKITYMRSDSTRLSDDFISESKTYIESKLDKKYYAGYVNTSKNAAQDAHEAIRPTDPKETSANLGSGLGVDETKLYKLIRARALASLMSPAKIKGTTVQIKNNGHIFSLSGQTVMFDGFLAVYNYSDKETELPEFKEGEKIENPKLSSIEKETTPPNRYSEASIIKTMEELGIGRPSTYASTVDTLKRREYVTVDKRAISVTDTGLIVDEFLSEFFSDIINSEFTSNMETILDEIENGTKKRVDELKSFYEKLKPLVSKALKEGKSRKPKAELVGEKCPECEVGDMVIRKSKRGEFQACNRFPRCRFTRSKDGTVENKEDKPVPTKIKCNKCNEGFYIQRKSSMSNEFFYGCNRYPNCKNIMSKPDMISNGLLEKED